MASDVPRTSTAASAPANASPKPPPSVMAGLRRRLLIMLLLPLVALACVSAWFDFAAAGSAAVQQDQLLQRMVPLVVGSVVAEGAQALDAPVVLLAPAIEDFLKEREGFAAWGLATIDGRMLVGDSWMGTTTPSTFEPEFHSELVGGVTYRIVAQRAQTAGGELVVLLADGSDIGQNWLRSLLIKVLLPNLLLIAAAALAVSWAVQRALRPLLLLKDALETRSPRDLSAIDASASPEEVRPMVDSLNRLFALVDAQAQTQRRFIADAAHQLRTPLAGLQAQVEAWAQAVNAKQPTQQASKATIALDAEEINRLRSATRRTSQLANQLLALSRADAQSAGSQPMQSVDLQALCSSVLEQQLDAASHQGIDLGLDIDTAQGALIVRGYEWLLRELLTNLCDNAVRHTPRGAHVTLHCRHGTVNEGQAQRVLLEVCDDGPGVAAHERARVLERFYRVQGTSGEGTGLGLAIADEIARLHGAHLALSDHNNSTDPASTLQRGLRIRVWLPAPSADTAPPGGPNSTPNGPFTPAFTRGIRAQ